MPTPFNKGSAPILVRIQAQAVHTSITFYSILVPIGISDLLLSLFPIEQIFSKHNITLHRAEVRSISLVEEVIAAALETITAHDARGQFRHFCSAVPQQCP